MKIRDAIAAGIAHLHQNRLRAGLSILGMLIGIASVLCMMAVGDGAKLLIAKDLEKLGGANQVQLWTRSTIWKRGRLARTTERYTLRMLMPLKLNAPMSYLFYRKMKDSAPTSLAADTAANPVRISKESPQIMRSVCTGKSKRADSSPRAMLKTQLRFVFWVPILLVSCSEGFLLLVKK